LGIEFTKQNSSHYCEHHFGFKVFDNGHYSKVTLVAPYSPAWKAGLFAGDEIMAVNGMMLKTNLNHWLNYFTEGEEIKLIINSNETIKTIVLQKDKKGNTYFFNPELKLKIEENIHFSEWRRF